MKILISRSSGFGRSYTRDVWRNVGGLRNAVPGSDGSSPSSALRPFEDLVGESVPAFKPLAASTPRRGIFTRFGFLWGFPMMFLLLMTNLWGTGWTFTSGMEGEHAISSLMPPAVVLLPAFFGGIMTVHRRKGLVTRIVSREHR